MQVESKLALPPFGFMHFFENLGRRRCCLEAVSKKRVPLEELAPDVTDIPLGCTNSIVRHPSEEGHCCPNTTMYKGDNPRRLPLPLFPLAGKDTDAEFPVLNQIRDTLEVYRYRPSQFFKPP